MRPQRILGIWQKMSTSSIRRARPRSPRLSKFGVMPAPSSKKPEEREIVVDPGASMHMLSRTDLSLEELEALQKSRNPTTAITANGEVPTNEDAHLDVDDLELFVTVHILEGTPAVLTSGKLCEEHGCSHEWASGQKPHLTKQGKTIMCKTDNLVPIVSHDCHQARAQVRLPHCFRRTRRVSLQVQQYNVTIPTLKHREIEAILQKRKTKITRRTTIKHRVIDCEISPDWFEEFTDNLEDTEGVSTRKHFTRLRFGTSPRKWHQGSICIFSHFPKDKNSEICKRTKIARALCRRRTRNSVPRAEKFGDLMTTDHSPRWGRWISKQSQIRCRGTRSSHSMNKNFIRVKQKLLRRRKGVYESNLEPSEKPEVFYTDNRLEFGKSCEDSSWNHCASTPHRSETHGVAERAVRRMKGRLQYCCNPAWRKNGGLVLWSAVAICEMSKTSWQMGKHLMNGDLENLSKDQSFRLAPWLNIILSLRKTSQGSINLVRKFCLKCSSDIQCLLGGSWKGDILVADVEELEILDSSDIHAGRRKRNWSRRKVVNISYTHSRMVQQNCLEDFMESEKSLPCGTNL